MSHGQILCIEVHASRKSLGRYYITVASTGDKFEISEMVTMDPGSMELSTQLAVEEAAVCISQEA